jgi:hypothetical protein
MQFFFQPADIVNQVLNFGQPAPIDIRVTARDNDAKPYAMASKLAKDLKQRVPASSIRHVFQVPDAPSLAQIDVDRTLAQQLAEPAGSGATNVLVDAQFQRADRPEFLGESAQQRQLSAGGADPTYRINSLQDLWTMPLATGTQVNKGQL